MRNSLICAAGGRVAFALSLMLLTGCATEHAGVVPPSRAFGGPARIVSSVVEAGGRSYVVDQIYTPSESNLSGIAPGPRGEIWFTGDTLVGKSSITSDMTDFFIPVYGNATSIVEGPDENLWVTLYPSAIGRVATNGAFTAFPIRHELGGSLSIPFSITNGPGKKLWFVADLSSGSRLIVRMALTGAMKGYRLPEGAQPQWLTYGSDGNLWFTDSGNNKIGRMSATGAVKEFSVPTPSAGLSGICQGPDGTMWFIEENANKVGSMSESGLFHEYPIPTSGSGAVAIAAGPDGALWFTEESAGRIGRITTSGKIVELKLSGPYARPFDITVGSDKNIWFTESQSYGIMGRVDLREVSGSDPVYSEIALALSKRHPELGISAKLPLSITVDNLAHHVLKGHYPNPIYLTTSDHKNASLSKTTLDSSTSAVSVLFSGHYTTATLSANAAGGGTVQTASMLPSTQPEKKLPHPGYGLTRGPKDSVWVCLSNGSIARYSMTGSLSVYRATTPFKEAGCSMLEGPDGNVWFTDYPNNRIGKITPSGHVTFFRLGSNATPGSMALGSDKAMWFTENFPSKIGRLTTSGQLTTFAAPATPYYIVAGPDGNLWYTASDYGIYKLTTGGQSKRVRYVYRLGAALWTANHNVWFYDAYGMLIEEMSTTGAIVAKYPVPNCLPFAATSGPENSIWYVDAANDCVARMTLSGTFFVVPTYSQKNNPLLDTGIVAGQNGYLWFTETGNKGLGWIDPGTI